MNYLHKLLLTALTLAALFPARAAAPVGYYNSLNGKAEGDLKTEVYNLIHNFTTVSSYSALPDYFRLTDARPQSDLWWDMYSDIPLRLYSFAGLNREHSFPKSWWGGLTDVTAYVDLNHLYPSEARANQAKSNYPLGEVDPSGVKFSNGITTVGYPVNGQGGGASQVFEPDDEYKGDFARTYFYMATCYQTLKWKYTYMVTQNLYPTLTPWAVQLLLKWHRADPVSQKEIDRNNAVYSIQSNRNPFIDLPELAEYIWGAKKGEKFTPGQVVTPPQPGIPNLIAPAVEMEALQFGQVALGDNAVTQLFIKGENLSGSIDISLYRDNADMFAVSATKIPAALVCNPNGYWLQVKYNPNTEGKHTARILIQGDFGSRGVGLSGECLPPPTLTAPIATAPTDILPNRYTANWIAPAAEVIDYYIVTRTSYTNGTAITEELPAEDTSLEILGFDESDHETYYVQSVRLQQRSPASNVIFVDHTGITGITVQQPLVIQTFPGYIRFICSTPQTDCKIFDPTGRLITTIPQISQNHDHQLLPGAYIITTQQHPTPIKVLVH